MSRQAEYEDSDEDFDEAPGDDDDDSDEDFDEAPDDDDDDSDEDFDEAPGDDDDDSDEDFDEAPDDDDDDSDEDFDEAPDDDDDDSDEDFDEAPDDDDVDFEEDRVFVIMNYTGEDCDKVFAAIKEECSLLGLEAEIAKNMAGSGLVVQEIYDATSEAEFIVCDLTGERQNVYYELGQAHGLGNKALRTLLVAKKSTKVHFDVSPFRVHFYDSIDDLRGIVRSQLDKMMGLTRS